MGVRGLEVKEDVRYGNYRGRRWRPKNLCPYSRVKSVECETEVEPVTSTGRGVPIVFVDVDLSPKMFWTEQRSLSPLDTRDLTGRDR